MKGFLKENKENKNKSLGEIIKEKREAVGLSQRQVARKLKIDNSGLAKIERGDRKKPSILILKKLSMMLGIDLAFLMKKAGYDETEIEIATSQTIFYRIDTGDMIEDMIEDKQKELDKVIKEKNMLEKLAEGDIIFNVIDETGELHIELNSFLKEQIKEREKKIKEYSQAVDGMIEILNSNVNIYKQKDESNGKQN